MAQVLTLPLSTKGQGFRGFSSCLTNASFEGTMFAVTTGNILLNFNPGSPGVINSARAITGLSIGENVAGIDFRPADGQLYAITNASRLYIINPVNGSARPVIAGQLNPLLNGNSFGVDFNPVPDRLRVVSDADQNLRINPNNGMVAVDGVLNYPSGDANIVGSAYTNSFSGATSTTLYGIDSNQDMLVTQGSIGGSPVSPNSGQLFPVGSLGVNTNDLVGFDIAPVTNAAFASLTPEGATASQLYTINLSTGAATPVGAIGGGQLIRDIAFAIRAENIFAVTSDNTLLSFNPGIPGIINNSQSITGLASGESIAGIDFRPATGQLYAITNSSRVYIVNTSSGAATAVGSAPFSPALSGLSFGVDFNPVPDRIRVVSDANQNLRLNPNNGAVAGVDTMLSFSDGDPSVVAAAYTNNFIGATSTTLYVIDTARNILATQGSLGGAPVSPNSGQLFPVGPLGVDPNDIAGFDISSSSGAAFASLNIPGNTATQLYSVNLTSGSAALIGAIGGGQTITDIAIEVRVPTVFAVTAGNILVSFNAGTPGVIDTTRGITGLGGGERIVSIDFRPATGQLYALSSGNRLYIINPATAAAALVNNSPFNPALSGVDFGVDFNPVPDRIRVVNNTDQNLRLNPNNGAVAGVDIMLAFAATDANTGKDPNISGSAYTNTFLGATSTTLYGIDHNLGILVTQGSAGGAPVSPNSGQLFTVGPLGVVTSGLVGFDIAQLSNAAFASLTGLDASSSQFFAVNLATGAATLIGGIGVNEPIRAIAIGSTSRVTNFDICLQDDRSGDTLQFNSCTGDYQFTRCGTGGFTVIGKGDIFRLKNVLTLRDPGVIAAVETRLSGTPVRGSAVVRPSSAGPTYVITDSGTANNTCSCR